MRGGFSVDGRELPSWWWFTSARRSAAEARQRVAKKEGNGKKLYERGEPTDSSALHRLASHVVTIAVS